jgi:excisionase family DNA binding protein
MARTRTDPTIPTDQEAILARVVSTALESGNTGPATLRIRVADSRQGETYFDLPPAASRLLVEMLKEMGDGKAVTLVPTAAEITTQKAADLLNVSRPFVVGLIEKGTLPARMVGNQRRLLLKDVLVYKQASHIKRLDALEELSALDQELGLR